MIQCGATTREIEARPEMPGWTTINRWLSDHPEFQQQYMRAREISAAVLEEQIMIEAEGANKENANAARVKIDAWKWIMGKRAPKKYGERVVNEHVGKDGGPIQSESTTKLDVSQLDAGERKALRDLMTKAAVKGDIS